MRANIPAPVPERLKDNVLVMEFIGVCVCVYACVYYVLRLGVDDHVSVRACVQCCAWCACVRICSVCAPSVRQHPRARAGETEG